MSKNEARRQKQLAKKKAKRTEKRTELARLHSSDPTVKLADAASWPIVDALMPDDLWHSGIGQLIIGRRMPDGHMACAIFLVDTYCLGVKNAFWKIMPVFDYDDLLLRSGKTNSFEKVEPEYFVKVIQGAVEYAQALGFQPHPDYRRARLLLAGIDPSLCSDTFEFGKDGAPFYVRGPNESLLEARAIAARINQGGGEFLIPMKEADVRVSALETRRE